MTMRWLTVAGLAFVTALSGAIMPGPLLAVSIGQVLAAGFTAVLWLMLGHALLEGVLLVLLVTGLRYVLARPRVRGGIGLIGGAALVYMGVDMVQQAFAVQITAEAATAQPWWMLVTLGAMVSLANPYFTGWWATIGVGQLAQSAPRTRSEYLAFYLGHEAADVGWYSLVAALVLVARGWLEGDWYPWLIVGFGVILVALGLWFLASGARLLTKAPARQPAAAGSNTPSVTVEE
jgi:threonine/homoserine/homoserine lactone efflux protein